MSKELQFSGERVVPNNTCHALTMAEHLIRYSFATKYAKVGKILDAACGSGYGIRLMGMLGANKTGMDVNPEAVDYSIYYNSEGHNNFYIVDFEKENLFNLLFGHINDVEIINKSKFDLITSFETIEHLADPNLFLQGISEVLKDNGKFIYSIPLCNPSDYHKVVYTFETAQELINKYFVHEEIFIQESLELVNLQRVNGNMAGLNKRGVFIIGVCQKKK